MSRWIKFLVAFVVGITTGLVYAWEFNPVEFQNSSPVNLDADYRTDYVLMVAETFTLEQDADLAAQRLAVLGSQNPAQLIAEALEHAMQKNLAPADLINLESLMTALQNWQPSP